VVEIYDNLLSQVISWQQKLNILITDYFDLLEDGDSSVFLLILIISFLYGLIHALGPGHGKMVISSYFLANNSNKYDAFKAGFLTSIVHTLSALLVTGTLYLFFQDTISTYFKSLNQNMYKVSAVFIILIALFLLYELLTEKNKIESIEPISNKRLFTVSFSIGIVPCPGVMSIVLYSMIIGYFYLGILSAITMSIGMGITISVSAIFAASLKKNNKFSKYKSIMMTFSYIGIFVLISIGVLLLV